MIIVFNSVEYELKDSINVAVDRLQASLVRGDTSVDELLLELNDIEKVIIKDDEKILKTYKKYTKPFAVAIYDDVISVELLNKILLEELEKEEE